MAFQVISGTFSATYAPASVSSGGTITAGTAADIGKTREGFRVRETFHKQDIITDDFGEAPVDAIAQGNEVEVTLDYVEYSKILPALYTGRGAQGNSKSGVGKSIAALGGPLVLTPLAGTPAAAATGPWTFYRAVVVSDIETLLASKARQGPITFHCYPEPSTGSTQDQVYIVASASSGGS